MEDVSNCDSLRWIGCAAAAVVQSRQVERPIIIPPPKGLVGRMVSASDGPKIPIPQTTKWVNPTTGEAAYLELLEGRNPFAMAHYANHPPAGAAPNTVIANFKFRLQLPGVWGGEVQQNITNINSSSSSSAYDEPWLRAYLPNIEYSEECSHQQLLHKVRDNQLGSTALHAYDSAFEVPWK